MSIQRKILTMHGMIANFKVTNFSMHMTQHNGSYTYFEVLVVTNITRMLKDD